MTIKHHVAVDRARKTAKALSRDGGMSHQQALDHVAREAGFVHWNAMASHEPAREMTPASDMPTSRMKPKAQTLEFHLATMMAGAERAHASKDTTRRLSHEVRSLPIDVALIARTVDPMGGPWDDSVRKALVRCPGHPDAAPSLTIWLSGRELHAACARGCEPDKLHELIARLLEKQVRNAFTFMAANDRSKVVSGAARDGGGRGGSYCLADGSRHVLDVVACRLLPEGYPRWSYERLPRGAAAVERALHVALAGRHEVVTTPPSSGQDGPWTFEVNGGSRYRILLTRTLGGPIGINSGYGGSIPPIAVETCATPVDAGRRVLELLKDGTTLDPTETAENQKRYEREVARNERVRGTVDGWGWWAGPTPEEMTYGGPYKMRQEAVSNGNGSCDEEGDHFWVVQARTDPTDEGDGDGMITFLETRSLKRIRST